MPRSKTVKLKKLEETIAVTYGPKLRIELAPSELVSVERQWRAGIALSRFAQLRAKHENKVVLMFRNGVRMDLPSNTESTEKLLKLIEQAKEKWV